MSDFASIDEGIAEIRAGRMLLIADDEDRENECDLVMAADTVTPEAINFMAVHGRGIICIPLSGERLDKLQIPLMVSENTAPLSTAFTVSVDSRDGVTTGTSAFDRARTIRALVDPATNPADLTRPGHVFPLRAAPGGVLQRAGHTEAGVDLALMAGLSAAAVICEVLTEDGRMARVHDVLPLAQMHGIKIITIRALIEHRFRTEALVTRVATTYLPTEHGTFRTFAYENAVDDDVPVALVLGEVESEAAPLVRIHSECLTGDVFGSRRCDCGSQLIQSLKRIQDAGSGVLVYMRQEGRGIGLVNKLRAYQLQDQGKDTVEANHALGLRADQRHYGLTAQILADLGIRQVRLLTNNPQKIHDLEAHGIHVIERIPLEIPATADNHGYLKTKVQKMGHLLSLVPSNRQAS